MHRYVKMGYLPKLGDEFIEVILNHILQKTSLYSLVLLNCMKGAVARVDPQQTPFVHRREQFHFDIVAQWTDPAEAKIHMDWVRSFWSEAEPFTRGTGVNFLDIDDGADRVKAAYGANYERLVTLKNKYDPTNFFRLNNNIVPKATV